MSDYTIEGINPVYEAIDNDREIDKLYIDRTKLDGRIKKIYNLAKQKNIIIQKVDRGKLDKMTETNSHQGVIARIPAYKYSEMKDIFDFAKEKGEDPFIVILDGITDTHNFGAIIRSACAAGAHGVITRERRAATITANVVKTSAGAIEYIPVVKVTNITRTINELKDKGIWFACADLDGKDMYDENLKGPIGVVVGAEGDGVSRLVKENCDFVVKMPMKGKIESLNASVAASLLMYEVVRQRR